MRNVSQQRPSRIPEWMILVGLFAVAMVAYVQFGTLGALYRDDALYMYSGQQFAQGIPPYKSLFVLKGPITPMLVGVGVWVANVIEVDDLQTVRLWFLLLSAASVVAVYLMARSILVSREAGLVAALMFLSCWGFGRFAMAGPRGKTPLVLFEALALWLIVERRWFAAGIFASLATLTWQPAGLFAVVAVGLAFLVSEPGERLSSAGRCIGGGILPLALICAYFWAAGAWPEFVEGFVTFNFSYTSPGYTTFANRWLRIGLSIVRGYAAMTVPISLGLGMIVLAYFVRGAGSGLTRLQSLMRDPFAPLLLSFPMIVAWSLVDYQDYPDFFILLPLVAVAFAWLVQNAAKVLTDRFGPASGRAWWAAWLLGLAMGSIVLYRTNYDKFFVLTRHSAQTLQARFGDEDWTLLTLESPAMNVLTHKRNPTRYLSFDSRIEKLIRDTEPGRFRGWLARLEEARPDVVVLGPLQIRRQKWVRDWLTSKYRQAPGTPKVWVRNPEKQSFREP